MHLKRFIYATLDNRLEIPGLADYPAGGINGAPLEVIFYRDIAAVVSAIDVDGITFDQPLDRLPEQQETYKAHLLKYQQVNAFLLNRMGSGGMLPLKFGFTVEKDQEMLFDDAVDEVATEFEEVLTFKYIGPLPVYSFVNIELNQGNFSIVDKSRKVLQLPDNTTWEAIKLAHHPDRNPDDPQAAKRIKEVIQAYEV